MPVLAAVVVVVEDRGGPRLQRAQVVAAGLTEAAVVAAAGIVPRSLALEERAGRA